MPWGSSSIFLELKKSILLYDLGGVSSRLDRNLMAIQTTNYRRG
jgi:hypothetical protein